MASTSLSPFDPFKHEIAQQVSTLLQVDFDKAYEGIESGKAGKNVVGDFQLAVPRFRLKGDPKAIAATVAEGFKGGELVEKAEATGAFLSFHAKTATLTSKVLNTINDLTYITPAPGTSAEDKKFMTYGTNQSGAGQSCIVEFSSPNIAKPFHAGHLRSTIIGAFVSNLYESQGWSVTRMNYLGDWGKQFGILAVGFEKYGSEEKLKEDAITHLYDVYVKINADAREEEEVKAAAIAAATAAGEEPPPSQQEGGTGIHDRARDFFKGMEDGDEKSLALWGKFRDLSIEKYREVYARLGIHFDVYSGESQVTKPALEGALTTLLQSGIVTEDKSALLIDLTKYKLEKTIVRKRDGTYVYITRDIGGATMRWEQYKFDKMIYVIASQQDLHTAQFFKVLNLMGYDWADRLQHVSFGMVTGMSTRKGTAVFLEQILDESKRVMHEQMAKNEEKYKAIEDPMATSDILGITAVKIQDMSAKRINNYDFKWERMTSFEGDTGPYIQYSHVRLSSVERKVAGEVVLPPPSERGSKINTELLVEPAARLIVSILATYPDVTKAAFKTLEPSAIVTFCFRLCHAVSSAWETLIVKGQPEDVALARLWLYVCARDTLASAMRLLTLEPVERM